MYTLAGLLMGLPRAMSIANEGLALSGGSRDQTALAGMTFPDHGVCHSVPSNRCRGASFYRQSRQRQKRDFDVGGSARFRRRRARRRSAGDNGSGDSGREAGKQGWRQPIGERPRDPGNVRTRGIHGHPAHVRNPSGQTEGLYGVARPSRRNQLERAGNTLLTRK